MNSYDENPKEWTKKTPWPNEQLGHKVNTQKSNTFLYPSNEQVEFEIKTLIPFILALPKYEIFRYNTNEICRRPLWRKLQNWWNIKELSEERMHVLW